MFLEGLGRKWGPNWAEVSMMTVLELAVAPHTFFSEFVVPQVSRTSRMEPLAWFLI